MYASRSTFSLSTATFFASFNLRLWPMITMIIHTIATRRGAPTPTAAPATSAAVKPPPLVTVDVAVTVTFVLSEESFAG